MRGHRASSILFIIVCLAPWGLISTVNAAITTSGLMNNNPNLAMTGAGAMMGNMGGLFSGGIGGMDPMMMGK